MMDCGVFQDRAEWRKNGGQVWNRTMVRIQECDGHAAFLGDIWKRFVVNESITTRARHGSRKT